MKSEDVAERHPPRRQRQASASLPQRVHFPVQPPLLPVGAFRSLLGVAGGVESPTFAELYSAIGCILHVVDMGVNRIGTDHSSGTWAIT